MSAAEFTPGPWELDGNDDIRVVGGNYVASAMRLEDCRLIAAAPELYEAADALERADLANANCTDCGGEGIPELCGTCFPLFDAARVKRRAALAKARGEQ